MGYHEQLENLIADKDGIVTTKEVEKSGIPRHYLTLFIREGILERVSQGIYVKPDVFEDDMYILQMKSPKVIFSHETALMLHELTDRIPIECSVTVPYGYNGSNLRKSGIIVHTVKKQLHLMGTTEMDTLFGRKVIAYSKERTICDIIRNRNNMDIAILNEAIKRYLRGKDKNISLLMRNANELRVQKTVRSYIEVLL